MTVSNEAPSPALQAISGENSAVNWEQIFRQQRICFTGGQRRGASRDFARLQNRVDELKRLAETFVKDSWLANDELKNLKPLLAEAQPILKQIDVELARIHTDETDLVPARVLEQILENAEQLMSQLHQQFRLVDEVLESANHLHEIVEVLIHDDQTYPARLQNLARRIIVGVVRTGEIDSLLPQPGISFCHLIPSRRWISEPMLYSHSIQTARTIAWMLHDVVTWSDRLESLVIAALLQDVGLLALESVHHISADQLEVSRPRDYRQHPSIGAGLAAGIEGFSVKLPPLISQHHERLDGTGFPRGLRSRRLGRPARLLAVASRFIELWETTASEISSDSTTNSLMPASDAGQPSVSALHPVEAGNGTGDGKTP